MCIYIHTHAHAHTGTAEDDDSVTVEGIDDVDKRDIAVKEGEIPWWDTEGWMRKLENFKEELKQQEQVRTCVCLWCMEQFRVFHYGMCVWVRVFNHGIWVVHHGMCVWLRVYVDKKERFLGGDTEGWMRKLENFKEELKQQEQVCVFKYGMRVSIWYVCMGTCV